MLPPASREAKSRPSQLLRTRNGHPGPRAWEHHKSNIIRLYNDRSQRLRDVVRIMEEEYGFRATEAMYKTRLRKWNVFRYKTKSQKPGISETTEQKPPDTSDSSLEPFRSGDRNSHTKYRDPMCDSGITDMASDIHDVRDDRLVPPDSHSQCLPQTWLGESACWVPQDQSCFYTTSSNASSSDDFQLVSNDTTEEPVDSATANDLECTHSDYLQSQNVMQLPEELMQIPTSSQYVLHPTQQPSCGVIGAGSSGDEWMIVPQQPSGIYRALEVRADPQDFVGLCVVYSKSRSMNNMAVADSAADEAIIKFGLLLRQQHRHAMTALHTIMVMFTLHDRSLEALELMCRAKETAREVFNTLEHPIVQTIEFFEFQAAGMSKGMKPDQLRQGYENLCVTYPRGHPYILVAGYLLAWSLAVDDQNEMTQLQSIRLLGNLQLAADDNLGREHLLSIAVLMVKARVQHSLLLIPDALMNMAEARRRMDNRYPETHPYVLEAKARYAAILFAAYKDDEAQEVWVESALGHVKVFGRSHKLSLRVIREVAGFFAATGRRHHNADFENRVSWAEQEYLRQRTKQPDIALGTSG